MHGFQEVLDHIRSISRTETDKGRLFERLMKAYLLHDRLYHERFTTVHLWTEWARTRADFDGRDTGIDLVAEERDGGVCAIQCKCHAPGTRIARSHINSFVAASDREPFTSRMIIDTGDEWGEHARNTVLGLKSPCTVLRFDDLASRNVDWPDLVHQQPEALTIRPEHFSVRPHQREAIEAVLEGFEQHDRGKLVMACGTGKTFAAMRIAEAMAGVGKRVLYLVPSISLFAQTMREWAEQRTLTHRYVGICSDTRAGHQDEDAPLQELEIPVTTDPTKIKEELRRDTDDAMTVVFSTYHSVHLVARAQDAGAPRFDLVLCDEAHRTTGVEDDRNATSPFVLVHDEKRVRADKRLYMTATPRLYTQSAKKKAARHDVEVFSMDDPDVYGPEFHRLPFSRAVEQDLLSDYKVVILAMSETCVDATLQAHLAAGRSEINLSDTAKMVGCWRALQNPEHDAPGKHPTGPLRRAIAFTNAIRHSKRLTKYWSPITDKAIASLPESEQDEALRCEVRHVDGQDHALERKRRIDWLKESSDGACRILSNARCLAEGVDVPALDAVLFMEPRVSEIDIVQAVGRAMRKAPGKTHGYIILPVAVPPDVDATKALDDNERFKGVWSVLRALRAHDERFNAEINQLDLNRTATGRIIFRTGETGGQDGETPEPQHVLDFPPLDFPPHALYATVVQHCGDRKYWDSWAEDIADIHAGLVTRIEGLLDKRDNATLHEWFDDFHKELTQSINESITRDDAVEMMAQHVLTGPVFKALFEDYDFTQGNPVARALERLRKDFTEFGLENEVRTLQGFYESVQRRAQGLDNAEARQRVLTELYQKFFATAMKKKADRLGIVYTPVEVVDFILASANHVLREEFGRSLSDEGVHVLDPFAGTGIFLARLLQSDLIRDADLARKYQSELHANEIVLLAYYIAAVSVEEAFHGRAGGAYEPFPGIVLTDTFNLRTGRGGFPMDWIPDNSERAQRQQKLPIQVIVGNPPWSAGQKSAADDNPNVAYPELEARVAETYAAKSRVGNKNSLYDTYKMALRWASDRIGEQGVVAFVTNGSWIDGNADSGVRACLADEFTSIQVLNLRGNQRTQGERSRREGGKVFGQGSRAPVAVTVLVRNPNAGHEDCRIRYHDIGDYLKREEKLKRLSKAASVAGVKDWQQITSDEHHDWFRQRDPAFAGFYAVGSKEAKVKGAEKSGPVIFRLFSNGYKTGKDSYIYNFSDEVCASNADRVVRDYRNALNEWKKRKTNGLDLDEVVARHASNVRWDRELKNNLRRMKDVEYSQNRVWETTYRPFIKQYGYIDYILSSNKYQMDSIFPASDTENRTICVPGVGATTPFSVLIVDAMPDLETVSKSQCFPRYRFEPDDRKQRKLIDDTTDLRRVDNITDTALRAFQTHYKNNRIDKDAVFDYVYGVLHAPDYRKRFANDLAKGLPRIPFAADFRTFAQAGRRLAALHLEYETGKQYRLKTVLADKKATPAPEHYRLGRRAMRFEDKEKTILIVNDHLRVADIPAEAHDYVVNGKSPLGWFIDRYRIKQDKESGIVNDPNDWFNDPQDLIPALRRIVHVSVETVRIVNALPAATDTRQGTHSRG